MQPVPQAAVHTRSHQEEVTLFNAWKIQHQKTYRADEEEHRFGVWKDNLKFVDEWNAKDNGHVVAMNHIADLTKAEFKAMLNGLRLPEGHTFEFGLEKTKFTGPASVDWRTQGYVTEVKNQQQCGSCYTFSSTGSMEGAVFKKTGKLNSISEQQLVDCSGGQWGNGGCNGGLMTNCFNYVIKGSKGEELESVYPYTAVQGKCQFSSGSIVSTISSFANITTGDETDLQNQCAANGPISVAIDASHQSFQLYSSGVYSEPACSTTQLDHGVLVVGYGTSGTKDYYIVKNSWGASWGQEGYIWMSRNKKNQCGIATMASYPID
jgi:cathepsin L